MRDYTGASGREIGRREGGGGPSFGARQEGRKRRSNGVYSAKRKKGKNFRERKKEGDAWAIRPYRPDWQRKERSRGTNLPLMGTVGKNKCEEDKKKKKRDLSTIFNSREEKR